MRVVFLFLLLCLYAVVVLGNHDDAAKKRHHEHDHDAKKRHHEHDHDKKVKHGVHKKSHGHQKSHGHKDRHHGVHQKHPEETRHGHDHHVAKKSHAGHVDHHSKRHHNLHHADHAKRLAIHHKRVTSRNKTTTTEIPISTIAEALEGSDGSTAENFSISTVSDTTSGTTDPTGDGEDIPEDGGEDGVSADTTTPRNSTTRLPPWGPVIPIPQFFWPPAISQWIRNITHDISDRHNCLRSLAANITSTIRANLRRNPQATRNISLTIDDRVVYNVSVQIGVTCPADDDDEDSTLSLGIISQAIDQSSCVNSISRNVTIEIIRDFSGNVTRSRHIVLSIDNQVVYDITLDLSWKLCTKPGTQQRAFLLHYLTGFPANVNGAYPVKRSGLNDVAKRVYDRLYRVNGKVE